MNKILTFFNDIFRSALPESQVYHDVEKKNGIWEEFAIENDGKVKLTRTVDNSLSKMGMTIPYKNCEIIFSESDIHPLKVSCKVENKLDFIFQLTTEDFIERIVQSIKKTEIEIGDREFDKQYLIETNDNERLLKILSNNELTQLLLKYKITNLQLKKEKEKYHLFLVGGYNIKSKSILNDILRIFKILIDFILI